ncbi:hypothetical protein E2C01_027714 [Portunus trituberculatus]|uniref:Uncharacterized protein n=1 Tax=Portunus trituberculatus TaxID=210409 RepID=A0A5B7EMD5_PORTR|nr:hypothetical protein [Portunus trituberculatus]
MVRALGEHGNGEPIHGLGPRVMRIQIIPGLKVVRICMTKGLSTHWPHVMRPQHNEVSNNMEAKINSQASKGKDSNDSGPQGDED